MGASAIPVAIMTVFWLLVGALLPWLVPRGPNRGLIQTMLVLTAICCWMFWFCCYLSQINPLFGPVLANETILLIKHEWEHWNTTATTI